MRKMRLPTARSVVGTGTLLLILGLVATGCSKSSGGGGGGPLPPPPPPPGNQTPVITQQPTASPSSATAGDAGQITLSFSATDADGDQLVIDWQQTGGPTSLSLVPSQSGNTYSAVFNIPSQDGTYSFRADVDDNNGGTVTTNAVSVTINPAGPPPPPPPPPPPAPPTINTITTAGLTVYEDVSSQVAYANGDFTGYTADMINVTNGAVERLIGNTKLVIRLPRQATAGTHPVDFTFTNGANMVSLNVNYTSLTSANFHGMINYETGGASGQSLRYLIANGTLGIPSVATPANGDDKFAYAPGETDTRFWILAQVGGDVHVFYHDVITGLVDDIQVAGAGLPHSIASLNGGKACAVLYLTGAPPNDFYNVRVIRENAGTLVPDPNIPLNVAGSEVKLADKPTAIQTFLRKENGLAEQDYAMFATGADGVGRALVMVRLTDRNYERGGGVTLRPDQLIISSDMASRRLRLTVMGNDGAGKIQKQTVLMDPAIALPNLGPATDLINSANRVSYALDGYNAANQQIIVYVEQGSDRYRFYNNTTGASHTESLPGTMTVAGMVRCEGNAWFAIGGHQAAPDSGTVYVIYSPDDVDFGAAPSALNNVMSFNVNGLINGMASNPTHVVAETRATGSDNRVAAALLSNPVLMEQNAPAVTTPPNGLGQPGVTSLRHASRDNN